MDRRTLIKLLLSTALAEAVDVEQLLWVPKPIITVPGGPPTLYIDAMLTEISMAYIDKKSWQSFIDRVFPRREFTTIGVFDNGQA